MKQIGIILPIDDDDRLASRCSKQGRIFYFVKFFKNFHLEAWNLTDETKHGLNEQQRCFKDPSLCGDC